MLKLYKLLVISPEIAVLADTSIDLFSRWRSSDLSSLLLETHTDLYILKIHLGSALWLIHLNNTIRRLVFQFPEFACLKIRPTTSDAFPHFPKSSQFIFKQVTMPLGKNIFSPSSSCCPPPDTFSGASIWQTNLTIALLNN